MRKLEDVVELRTKNGPRGDPNDVKTDNRNETPHVAGALDHGKDISFVNCRIICKNVRS